MRFGIFFSYWEDDWKGDYFKYVKKARELGYDALEVSAGELLVMSKDKLRVLRAVSKDLDIQISANLGPPRKYDVSSRDPEVRKAGLAFYSDLMDAMDVLG
ncbi:MAG: sugar phosphate isomerase/epimerase, partial [Ruminococcus bromii]|nr:sugar phosphate isomerase/epimerase [Ruminococcus bromii]